MLDRMARRGVVPRNIADIGTGTGLLAFAGLALWPRARMIASDIDPASIFVTRDNAGINGVPLGRGGGRLAVAVAPGIDHPAIRHRAPYDLVIANILAGPLITLAPDIASVTAPGGHAILAGLIARQMEPVLAAYRAQGFRLAARGEAPTGRACCSSSAAATAGAANSARGTARTRRMRASGAGSW